MLRRLGLLWIKVDGFIAAVQMVVYEGVLDASKPLPQDFEWFPFTHLPFQDMPLDVPQWMPFFIQRQYFVGTFIICADQRSFRFQVVHPVDELPNMMGLERNVVDIQPLVIDMDSLRSKSH